MDNKKARVVIVGGGFGGLFTALDLGRAHEVTLISDADHFLFTPMLYEYLSGEVEAWHIAPAYKELLDESVNLICDEVTDVDVAAQTIRLKEQSEPLQYDILVLAVGGVTNFAGVAGAAEYAIPFRKIAHADRLRQVMVDALDRVPPDLPPQDTQRALTFAVVGAGASGVELSTKMADLLRDAFKRRALRGEPRVLVIEMGDKIVPGMGGDIREVVEVAMRESRVEVHTLTRVVSVTEKTLVFEHDGARTEIDTAAVVAATLPVPPPLTTPHSPSRIACSFSGSMSTFDCGGGTGAGTHPFPSSIAFNKCGVTRVPPLARVAMYTAIETGVTATAP